MEILRRRQPPKPLSYVNRIAPHDYRHYHSGGGGDHYRTSVEALTLLAIGGLEGSPNNLLLCGCSNPPTDGDFIESYGLSQFHCCRITTTCDSIRSSEVAVLLKLNLNLR